MIPDDWYRVLDLEPGSSLQDVKTAYRQLAKVWHPDRFSHDPQLAGKATEKLKQINHAYEELCEYLKNHKNGQVHHTTQRPPPPRPQPAAQEPTSPPFTASEQPAAEERLSLGQLLKKFVEGDLELSAWQSGKLGFFMGLVILLVVNLVPTKAPGWESLLLLPIGYLVGLFKGMPILRWTFLSFIGVGAVGFLAGLFFLFSGKFSIVDALRAGLTGGGTVAFLILVFGGIIYLIFRFFRGRSQSVNR